MRVFLGGTCANTTWRNELIPLLEKMGIDYFNPVVDDWTEDCQAIEDDEKSKKCNVHLYVITHEMMGVYSIAEAIDSAHMIRDTDSIVDKCVFCVLNEPGKEWQEYEVRSFNAIMKLIRKISPENTIACYINNMNKIEEKIQNKWES